MKIQYFQNKQALVTEGQDNSPEEFIMPEDSPNPQLYEDNSESFVNSLVHDYFVNMAVMLPSLRGYGTADLCKVQRPARDDTNETVGHYSQNPLLNMMLKILMVMFESMLLISLLKIF